VALGDGHRVALFFSGSRHAGENLAEVLKLRARELPPPIQMCDALSRNLPGELQSIVAHCLAHARRQFVDVYDRFPEQCRYLLEALAVVYRNEADARRRQLTPEARLRWHQEASQPTMQELHAWLTRQLDGKLTEPNSALGGAIRYMLRHWEELTLFLRQAGAPLDNNLCERALKKAILRESERTPWPSPPDARRRAALRGARQVGRARAHCRRPRTGFWRRPGARGPSQWPCTSTRTRRTRPTRATLRTSRARGESLQEQAPPKRHRCRTRPFRQHVVKP
jgi:hypothetical protein